MNALKTFCIVVCLSLVIAPSTLSAANPLNHLLPFKWVEADPDSMYELSETNGPWTIMATSFSGDTAEDDARALVHELRKDYKLPAYSYRKRFDFSKGVEGRGLNKYGDVKRMKYQRSGDIVEIAVLVGDYPTVDDKQAQKVLKKLKFLHPKSLEPKKGNSGTPAIEVVHFADGSSAAVPAENSSTSQSLASVRQFQRKYLSAGSDRNQRGPMSAAFVITNPLLPKEYFAPKGIDSLVVQMNKGVKHSLLDCRGKYTVKIATFTGAIIIDQKIIKATEEGGKFKSRLEDAADKAHTLTEALRAKGVEAYEFHDRYSSIVTVGSFDSVGTPRDDGKIEINPAMHAIIKTYGADSSAPAGAATQKSKNVKGIPFDVSPIPVEVPRRSIGADYSRTADAR